VLSDSRVEILQPDVLELRPHRCLARSSQHHLLRLHLGCIRSKDLEPAVSSMMAAFPSLQTEIQSSMHSGLESPWRKNRIQADWDDR